METAPMPIIQGGEAIETRWWVSRPINQDVYNVHVIRYHRPIEDDTIDHRYEPWSENLTEVGWKRFEDGFIIEPILVLPGRLVHALSGPGFPLDDKPIVEALRALAQQIYEQDNHD